jgi:hypothetical protein
MRLIGDWVVDQILQGGRFCSCRYSVDTFKANVAQTVIALLLAFVAYCQIRALA